MTAPRMGPHIICQVKGGPAWRMRFFSHAGHDIPGEADAHQSGLGGNDPGHGRIVGLIDIDLGGQGNGIEGGQDLAVPSGRGFPVHLEDGNARAG